MKLVVDEQRGSIVVDVFEARETSPVIRLLGFRWELRDCVDEADSLWSRGEAVRSLVADAITVRDSLAWAYRTEPTPFDLEARRDSLRNAYRAEVSALEKFGRCGEPFKLPWPSVVR